MKTKKSPDTTQGNNSKTAPIIAKCKITLNPQEALVSSLFKQHGTIDQFIANEHGVMRLAARICDLKAKGAVISTHMKDIIVDGIEHPRVAFYTLKGWEL